MRAYLVEVGGHTRLAGSQAEVREMRDTLGFPRGYKPEEVEVSLAKPALLAFINGLLEKKDL